MAAATGDVPVSGPQTPANQFTFVNDELVELYKRAPFRLTTYGGTSDAITADGAPFNINLINGGTNALLDGQLIQLTAQADNTTTTPTLAVDAVAAKTIVHETGAALAAGEIKSGVDYTLKYESTPDELRIVARGVGGNITGVADLTLLDTDTGSGIGPSLTLYRDSSSPAAFDAIGSLTFDGEDSAGGMDTYNRIRSFIIDPTATSEDGRMAFDAANAGSLGQQMDVGNGVRIGSPTGGLKGAGTLNATAVYDDDVLLTDIVQEAVERKDGKIDIAYWDAMVCDLEGFEAMDMATGEKIPPKTTRRTHYAATMLQDMMNDGFKPWDRKNVVDWFRKTRTLPGMRSAREWNEKDKPSLGEQATRAWMAKEIMMCCICCMADEIDVLETRVKKLEMKFAK